MRSNQDNISNSSSNIILQYSGLVETKKGIMYRDLNKNGKLDIYEDPRQPIEARVEDLLGQMTLEEKAGMLFINGARSTRMVPSKTNRRTARVCTGGRDPNQRSEDEPFQPLGNSGRADRRRLAQPSSALCRTNPARHPVTIASDPRNHFSHNIFSMSATDFSQWCETWALPRLAMLNWCGSLPTLSGGNIWRWGFAWRSTRKLISPPNRAGRASAAPLGRMPT